MWQPNAGRRRVEAGFRGTARLSRLRMEKGRGNQTLHQPFSCVSSSAHRSPLSETGQTEAARIGTQEGRDSHQHSVH